jgi:hypothetical protein
MATRESLDLSSTLLASSSPCLVTRLEGLAHHALVVTRVTGAVVANPSMLVANRAAAVRQVLAFNLAITVARCFFLITPPVLVIHCSENSVTRLNVQTH